METQLKIYLGAIMLDITTIKEDVRRARDMGDRDAMNRIIRFHFPLLFNVLKAQDERIQKLEEELDYFTDNVEDEPDSYDGPDLDDWTEKGPDDFEVEWLEDDEE